MTQGVFNPPSLDLTLLRGSILWPNNSWKYLDFIFDRKLTFYQHVDFYANKSISTVKCMKLLGNSNRDINPLQKHLLCCGNHLSQRQVTSQTVNLLIGYLVGCSQENSTRSLFLINVLFIQSAPGPCYNYLTLPYSSCSILMSASLLTQGHHVYSMCPDVIFQTLLPCSRLMTSHHVICHVTSLSHAFFIVFPRRIK